MRWSARSSGSLADPRPGLRSGRVFGLGAALRPRHMAQGIERSERNCPLRTSVHERQPGATDERATETARALSGHLT